MHAAQTHRRIPIHGILVATACVLIGLMAAQPLLYGNLPFGADTLLHLYRVVQLDELVRQGVLYSRWAPDLAFGYGYPLFNYYAPGVYYLVEALHLLGMDFVPALMGASALLLVAAALFTYLFTRDLTSSAGALIAAAGYAFAPYMILIAVHTGSISQLGAMALLPLVFWAFRRATVRGGIGAVLIAAIAFAALMLCHNITTLLATPFVALCVGVTVLSQRPTRSAFAIAPVIAFALGLGLTAFYWLPVLTETTLVQLDRTILGTAFDFHANFVTVGNLLTLPQTYDLRQISEFVPYAFSLPVLAAAILGGFALIRARARADGTQALFAVAAVAAVLGCVFFTTPASQPLWDALPMLRFVQFPTRILSIASLFLAVLAGMGLGRWLEIPAAPTVRGSRRTVALAAAAVAAITTVMVGGFATYAFFWQNIMRYPPLVQPAITDFAKYERDNGWIGTTSLGEYLPATVQTVPAQSVVGQMRFNNASVPVGAELRGVRSSALDHSVSVASTVAWAAEFNVFMFPGWTAEIDGQPAPITPTNPHGLISVATPSGLHQVSIHFRETPARTAADALSLACVALVLIGAAFAGVMSIRLAKATVIGGSTAGTPSSLTALDEAISGSTAIGWKPTAGLKRNPLRGLRWLSNPRSGFLRESGVPFEGMPRHSPSQSLLIPLCVSIAIAALLVLKTTTIDTADTLFYSSRYDGARVIGVRQELAITFDHQIDLIGVDAPETGSTADGVDLTLYWRAKTPPPGNLSVGVELADSQGFVVGRSDHQHPAGFPVIRWNPTGYAADTYHIALKPGTPPGPYSYRVTVYRYDQPAARLAAFDKNGALTGTTFDSMSVSVITTTLRRAPSIAGTTPFTPQVALNASVNANATLIGFDLPFTSTAAGERLPVTLYWRVGAPSASDWDAAWTLTMAAGGTGSTEIKTEAIAGYPASQWVAGDEWVAPHTLRIPTATPSGRYRLSIRAADNPPVFLAEIDVNGSEHVLTPPGIARAVAPAARFSDAAELVGYDIPAIAHPGDVVTVTLLWHAYGETEARYKTFVHLVDASDNRVTGVDSSPVNGARPTSGWMQGEYIIDARQLQIPKDLASGTYTIKTGLYNERNLQRLTLTDGANVVTLATTVRVER